MRLQIFPELLYHCGFVVRPVADGQGVRCTRLKEIHPQFGYIQLRSISHPFGATHFMLSLQRSALHAMWYQIFAEFFGHHRFVIRPVDGVPLCRGAAFKGDDVRADHKCS